MCALWDLVCRNSASEVSRSFDQCDGIDDDGQQAAGSRTGLLPNPQGPRIFTDKNSSSTNRIENLKKNDECGGGC